ncbi:hypothetical protein U1839_14485 [Sphingomonas sp. RT2P30]|uniref:hypothetical protein n=1 Tax=Parasphingomonas halimpatiens TaxID=3096162 RepID=UPI002FC89C17
MPAMRHALLSLVTVAALAGATAAGGDRGLSTGGSFAVRPMADGAAPSHVFWLTHDRAGAGEIVGVIDPLFAAIRWYRIADQGPDHAALHARMTAIGACALPVALRPWRVHHLKHRVVIESMPEPGAAGYRATTQELTRRSYTIRRDLFRPAAARALLAGLGTIDTPGWDPASAYPCGVPGARRPIGLDAGATSLRGARRSARTITLRNGRAALAPASPLSVRSADATRYRLLSARELEPALRRRIVQTSELLPGDGGAMQVRQSLLVIAHGRVVRRVALDGRTRSGKIVARPFAVLPSGEIVKLGERPGPRGASGFDLFDCGNIAGGAISPACLPTPVPRWPALAAPRPARHEPSRAPLSARAIFAAATPLGDARWSVDTRALPAACRSAAGCAVPGQTARFVALRGIRLTRGVYAGRGIPYAQTGDFAALGRFLSASPADLSRALGAVQRGGRGWPGNLADGLVGDLGIDCSALVQIAWGRPQAPTRWTVATIRQRQDHAQCSRPLPSPAWLRAGDAIATAPGANHIMLFAERLRIGGNDAWLVLEASSACDGVCWTIFDPSVFDGWSLYRASGRSDAPCPGLPVLRRP